MLEITEKKERRKEEKSAPLNNSQGEKGQDSVVLKDFISYIFKAPRHVRNEVKKF